MKEGLANYLDSVFENMFFLFPLLASMPPTTAVFFHEHSVIELKGHDNSAFGFSLGYQKGSDAKLVIGAPRYSREDYNGRVSQCSIRDIDTRKTCNNIPIKLEPPLKVNRTLNPDQYFYLGASIAATEKGFVTCAPLRTTNAVINHETKYDAFGVCFTYDDASKAARPWNLHSDFSDNLLEGGGGWSTLVDEKRDRIIISQFMTSMNTVYGDISKTDGYTRLLNGGYRNHTNVINKMATYGQAMTFGNYFYENNTNTYYAFSMKTLSNTGAIDFFSCDNFELLETRLEDTAVGSMFGAALASADVTGDGRHELIVGAPAQVDDATSCDRGAVHVYTHTVKSGDKSLESKLTIWGVEDGGRFGTTIATNDVDGDSYPEIIISAPFEKAGGAVYVICGYEIHKLMSPRPEAYERSILVWDLTRMQKIQGDHSFGLSLQPITDFNENGSDELAVGSPTKSTVTLYRGVRAITVNVTSQFKNDVTTANTEFAFFSCVTVGVPSKPKLKIITTKLLVRNMLTGENASFKAGENGTYELNFQTVKGNYIDDKVQYCKKFHIYSPLSCKVNTIVSVIENIQEEKEFKNTWVTLSQQSNLNKTSYPICKCNGTCAPDYTLEVQWAGSNQNQSYKYVVGSSDQEMVNIVVRNHGTMGCNSCSTVQLSGTIAHTLSCNEDKKRQYKCELPMPFRAGTNKTIDIRLLTNTLSNQERNLTINVSVRKDCNESEAVNSSLVVNYDFRKVLEKVILDGSTMNRSLTDTEIRYEAEETFIVKQTFTILNNQSFKWTNVSAEIDTDNLPYIHDFKVWMKQPMTYCTKSQDTSHRWRCLMNLAQNSVTELTVTTTVVKKKLDSYLQGNNMTFMESKLKLELFQDEIKEKILTSLVTYERVLAGVNNTHITIVIAFVVALVVLFLVALILYKLNFFKRKNKEELEELKREMQNRSTRSVTSKSSGVELAALPAPERDCDTSDLIVDETPFDDSLSPAQLNCLAANPELTPKSVLTPMPEITNPGPKTEVLTEIALK